MGAVKILKRIVYFIFMAIVPRFIYYAARLFMATCKREVKIPKELAHTNCILMFWHGQFLLMPFAYLKLRKKPRVFVVIGTNFYGRVLSRICKHFGFYVIGRKESENGGVGVLRESFKLLRLGFDVALTPDGPRGPYHSIAGGVISMNGNANTPLVPIKVRISRYWELKSWDKMQIPKPFSKITYEFGEPFDIDSNASLATAKDIIGKKMCSL